MTHPKQHPENQTKNLDEIKNSAELIELGAITI
jgi:hypothetical protein